MDRRTNVEIPRKRIRDRMPKRFNTTFSVNVYSGYFPDPTKVPANWSQNTKTCLVKTLLLSYLHIVLYCVEGLHDVDAGHEPDWLWDSYMWCAFRCWFTHCPWTMPGPQSFLHSCRQVCHEHGGGGPPPPPPQVNTRSKALARTRTAKTRASAISLWSWRSGFMRNSRWMI